MNNFIYEFANQLTPIILATLTSILSYVAVKIKKAIEQRFESNRCKEIVHSCIYFVEQTSSQKGRKKYDEAYDLAESWLTQEGIKFSVIELRCLIESEVLKLNKEVAK